MATGNINNFQFYAHIDSLTNRLLMIYLSTCCTTRSIYTTFGQKELSMEDIETYPISKARDMLSSLFNRVIGSNQIVELTRRGIDSTALLVPNHYEVITNKKVGYQEKLPVLIADFLLPNAQASFVEAQISDLKTLSLEQLLPLLAIKKLPLGADQRKSLSKIVGQEYIDRLEQRHRVSVSIQEAEELGLYEANEHLANKLPW